MFLSSIFIISITMASSLMVISKILEKTSLKSKESSSSFECGFNSMSNKSKMVSGQFFSIAILFLIFDVEIGLIIPIPLSESSSFMSNWTIAIIMMFFLMSTKMEWKMGMIEWSK